jgi:CheY-like chemotaxis protein
MTVLHAEHRAEGCKHVVAIVDDDKAIRETLSFVLQDEGYETVTAADGREAIDALRQTGARRPCLILLDLMMPIMTGTQFHEEQQLDPALASIPVCLLSADGDLPRKAAAMDCEFLAKPMLIDQVLDLVHRHCATTAANPGE